MSFTDPPHDQDHDWRDTVHDIIFGTDTPIGKNFDIVLLVAILASVLAVCLESVDSIRAEWGDVLRWLEWGFTFVFTIEYILRLISVRYPLRYAFSFFGVVDLLSILPSYLSLFFVGSQSLIVIRALRLLRVFRVLKLMHFVGEGQMLRAALRGSIHKITVFLGTVVTLVLIIGAIMYLIESDESGFTSIPQSMYWAIVTMTTVGYGDIAPETILGKFLASIVMIVGYGII
ncbi:MAG: ion transporter, partial [Acidobacteriota bacterium]